MGADETRSVLLMLLMFKPQHFVTVAVTVTRNQLWATVAQSWCTTIVHSGLHAVPLMQKAARESISSTSDQFSVSSSFMSSSCVAKSFGTLTKRSLISSLSSLGSSEVGKLTSASRWLANSCEMEVSAPLSLKESANVWKVSHIPLSTHRSKKSSWAFNTPTLSATLKTVLPWSDSLSTLSRWVSASSLCLWNAQRTMTSSQFKISPWSPATPSAFWDHCSNLSSFFRNIWHSRGKKKSRVGRFYVPCDSGPITSLPEVKIILKFSYSHCRREEMWSELIQTVGKKYHHQFNFPSRGAQLQWLKST